MKLNRSCQRGGPRHAHSEGKTGPRLYTHEIGQNRFWTPKTPFLQIQSFQFKFYNSKTLTNNSNNLKWAQNINLPTQNSTNILNKEFPNQNSKLQTYQLQSIKNSQEQNKTRNYLNNSSFQTSIEFEIPSLKSLSSLKRSNPNIL